MTCYAPETHFAYAADDGAIQRNPGMGVLAYIHSDHMYVADGDTLTIRSVTEEDVDRIARLPFIGGLYVRVEWWQVQDRRRELDLCPEFRWAREAAVRHGLRWGFRIMPASPQSPRRRSTPAFLDDRLRFRPYPNTKPRFSGPEVKETPVYDEAYLGAWDDLLAPLGERFDGDPNLDFVDVSGFGKWGEWHHWPEPEPDEGDEWVARRLIDLHHRRFPRTPAAMPMIVGGWRNGVMDETLNRGFGVRRDTLHPEFRQREAEIAQRRRPGAPFVFEPGIFPDQARAREGAPTVRFEDVYEPMLDFGATHVGIGFNPWHADHAAEHHHELMGKVARRLGYRLRPAVVSVGDDRCRLIVHLRNDGVASPPGPIRLVVRQGDAVAGVADVRSGELAPGSLRTVGMELVRPIDRRPSSPSVHLSAETLFGGRWQRLALSGRPGPSAAPGLTWEASIPKYGAPR